MTRVAAAFIAGLCSTAHAASFAHAASLDCARAQKSSERLICADPALSRQDEQLAASYKLSRQQFDPAANGTKATLADLASAEQAWLAQRDACRNAACLTAAYAQQIAVLGFHGRPGHDSPADRWAGRYDHKGFVTLLVQVRDDQTVRVSIAGAEPGAARWTCAYAGLAKVDQVNLTATAPAGLTAQLGSASVDLPSTPANQTTSDASCGLNGSILWRYVRSTVQAR